MAAFTHENVIVPIDFSPASANAIQVALELTGDIKKLRFLHILAPLETISPAAVWGTLSESERERSLRLHAAEFLQANGAGSGLFDVRHGNSGLEIADYARECNADLIIISSHGYHGLKRLLLGSVAESILRHAHCAVLVLRRQDAE